MASSDDDHVKSIVSAIQTSKFKQVEDMLKDPQRQHDILLSPPTPSSHFDSQDPLVKFLCGDGFRKDSILQKVCGRLTDDGFKKFLRCIENVGGEEALRGIVAERQNPNQAGGNLPEDAICAMIDTVIAEGKTAETEDKEDETQFERMLREYLKSDLRNALEARLEDANRALQNEKTAHEFTKKQLHLSLQQQQSLIDQNKVLHRRLDLADGPTIRATSQDRKVKEEEEADKQPTPIHSSQQSDTKDDADTSSSKARAGSSAPHSTVADASADDDSEVSGNGKLWPTPEIRRQRDSDTNTNTASGERPSNSAERKKKISCKTQHI